MKISELNDWLSLIANIGVLVGLIFLVFEIQQNTKANEREISINATDSTSGKIVDSESLTEILVLISDIQGNPGVVTEYIETYGMTAEQAQRWWRFILQTWQIQQADWIYNGRNADQCNIFQLQFLDHQIFFKHMGSSLNNDFIQCLNLRLSSMDEAEFVASYPDSI